MVNAISRPHYAYEETRYPLYTRQGGTQDRSGSVQKVSPTPGFDSQTFQLVASSYTDWAIPALQ